MKNLYKLYVDMFLVMLAVLNMGIYITLNIYSDLNVDDPYQWILTTLLGLFFLNRVIVRIKNKDF